MAVNIRELKENVILYEDYKYVLQDVGNIYLGARFSYGELLKQEAVPFKLKAILTHYVLKESDPETTLESQFYYLTGDSFLYEVFSQLKIHVKVQRLRERKTLLGKVKTEFKEEVLSLAEIAGIDPARKEALGMMVKEIVISKLGMMTFSV